MSRFFITTTYKDGSQESASCYASDSAEALARFEPYAWDVKSVQVEMLNTPSNDEE